MVYHTYNAIEVAYRLLEHGVQQGKCFTNLQLQKLTYVSHGLSLAHYNRPLIIENIYAWKYGPVVPSVYVHFKKFGADVVVTEQNNVKIDGESDELIADLVGNMGDLSGPQLVELTHREGSPWSQVWDAEQTQIIPDHLIKTHYQWVLKCGRAKSL